MLEYTLLALLIAVLIAFVVGVSRARSLARANQSVKLHSQLGYYGYYLAIWTVLPAAIVLLIWSISSSTVIQNVVQSQLPANILALSDGEQNLVMGRVNSVAGGVERMSASDRELIEKARLGFATLNSAADALRRNGIPLGSAPERFVIEAAYDTVVYRTYSVWLRTGVVALLALFGFLYAYRQIKPRMRARNSVETVMLGALLAASTVAVLTTVGIVFSVLFESIRFFSVIDPSNFYLGTVWDPRFTSADDNRGQGQFGFLPLLWGTLYISFIALLVAVPIGLYSAIYLSEYASSTFRGFAKPALEVLAGIPTIVYGFFALITVGPFLRDTGAAVGLDIGAISVLTAGLVMGIMIIPFVSSLSDDIISSVPQSLREGSLGLGATKSETIKRVILPAALPGIVGAVLLAASRAIGETMIVVLAAGAAANLSLNPFEPMTTITVKIVSQLTGDLEFTSPQTLVAFALGLTLFVITLAMNIYALYIVRQYKEQYD
ncbi:MAG: phosphate ABC transporter permease subunit PstC [Pseudomonadota bacterium]